MGKLVANMGNGYLKIVDDKHYEVNAKKEDATTFECGAVTRILVNSFVASKNENTSFLFEYVSD